MDGNLISLKAHKYFSKAISRIENHPHYRELVSLHAAVIVKGGSILSVGINTPKRNMFVDIHALHENFTTHAELDAILRARRKIDLRGAKIYVARLRKVDGDIAMSKPCESCQEVIRNYGIKKVYYTTAFGFDTMSRAEIMQEID